MDNEWETTGVLICGCGPTGAMLSGYLGRMDVAHVVLEKEADVTTDPRGIALDEDGIRLLQGLGLYDHIFTEIGSSMDRFHFISGAETTLHKKGFFSLNYSTSAGPTGHPGFICHKQPVLERNLRVAMAAAPACSLRLQSTVVGLEEDENWTYCTYKDSNGSLCKIRARFLVGSDGKTGYTRKNYLEPRGIVMERVGKYFYEETWVALNWHITLPTPETHPEFPLWKLGFTPTQVYDSFFPNEFRFLCNPHRPAVCGRFGLYEDRLWRFEFVVRPEEDGQKMSEPEMIRKVVFPYITHSGSRYGLDHDVQFPEDCIQVLRSRPFMFSARSCNAWAKGRVILCGDSAHVFPPFGGQGIVSGFRDAISLSWRLAMLCRYHASSTTIHEKVLTAWYLERKQQLEHSLALTIKNGRFVTEGNPTTIFIRDWYFWFVQLLPHWRQQVELGPRKEGLIRYEHSAGMPFMPELNGGLYLPQVYCKSAANGKVFFTDDIIFHPRSRGIFQIFVYLRKSSQLELARRDLDMMEGKFRGETSTNEVPFIIEEKDAGNEDGSNVFFLASGEEFAISPLCNERPEPTFFDPLLLGKCVGGRFVIVRPDRFIFASCDDVNGLEKAVTRFLAYVHG